MGRRGAALSQEKQIGYCLRLSVTVMIAARTRMQGQIAAPGSSPAASDLAHNPSVGSEAATEVNNPAAPPYSPLHTTLGMPSPARARPFKLVTRY